MRKFLKVLSCSFATLPLIYDFLASHLKSCIFYFLTLNCIFGIFLLHSVFLAPVHYTMKKLFASSKVCKSWNCHQSTNGALLLFCLFIYHTNFYCYDIIFSVLGSFIIIIIITLYTISIIVYSIQLSSTHVNILYNNLCTYDINPTYRTFSIFYYRSIYNFATS